VSRIWEYEVCMDEIDAAIEEARDERDRVMDQLMITNREQALKITALERQIKFLLGGK